MLQLRPFTSHDYAHLISWVPTLHDFYLCCGTTTPWPMIDADLAERAAQDDIDSWTAVLAADETISVGHLELVRTSADTGRFARVLIAPQFRGQGLAGHLVAQGIAAARDLGVRTVKLNVILGNEPALRTYTGMGFRPMGVNPEHTTMLQMTRTLDTAGSGTHYGE